MTTEFAQPFLDAFCVDLEEWFHVCGVANPYSDPSTWDGAPKHVIADTRTLLRLLEQTGTKATFLTLGWIAERYPDLVREVASAGHEIGCHGHHHRLLFEMTPESFEEDLVGALTVLRQTSGQEVAVFRAPGFSLRRDCFWAYPILAKHGIRADVSIVPATRDHGGIPGFNRDPVDLRTGAGRIRLFPVSVLRVAGRTVPFSGGGYLRLLPVRLVEHGFAQNHREGRPCMLYVHPREINPAQPRMPLPWLKRFKYYVGLHRTEAKLAHLLRRYRFGTVTDVLSRAKALRAIDLDGLVGRKA
jgi:polysaccharide deacetylase family protein (PEP-CTERM system associated)